ncbi:transcriptional regulator [Halopseudomonas bauzanensis]|nr:transcriptional regulator [Halopseudomonas bauzanensis]
MGQDLYLYESISLQLRRHIEGGSYRPGQRLPSVRSLSRLFNTSVNTIIQCLRQLEQENYIEIRARSGTFVAACPPAITTGAAEFEFLPVEISLSDDILHYMEPHHQLDLIHLGIALPDPQLMPMERIMNTLRDITRKQPLDVWDYTHPKGHQRFTLQLARRSLHYPNPISQDDVIITNGCMEAIDLALRTVTRPGDTVAVESPTYYGTLLALEVLRRKVLEIPTSPSHGICLSTLELAFKHRRVSACLVSPNAQNPLGFTMSEENKQKLVELATHYNIPIIENDVWGDTLYSDGAMPAKAYDHAGMVLYCHSFSKSLIPGIRLGWVAPGRFHHRLRELKLVSSITTASAPQLLLARLMESGFYAQHLVSLRQQLAAQADRVRQAVLEWFPPGTSVQQPSGGCVLWVVLPSHMNSHSLFEEALRSGIHIFPGSVFSPGQRYAHCLRLNVGRPVNSAVLQAVRRLGEIARRTGSPTEGPTSDG